MEKIPYIHIDYQAQAKAMIIHKYLSYEIRAIDHFTRNISSISSEQKVIKATLKLAAKIAYAIALTIQLKSLRDSILPGIKHLYGYKLEDGMYFIPIIQPITQKLLTYTP